MVEEAQNVALAAGPLARLGVDWRLLVAQLVNFGLVLFVMWKWVYRPLLKVMDERTQRIEQGLKDAETAAAERQGATVHKEQVITEARLKARDIIEEAERTAKASHEEQIKKTRLEVESIVKRGKEQLKAEQAAMLAAARTELADLVVAASGKVLSTKMNSAEDAALVKAALAERE